MAREDSPARRDGAKGTAPTGGANMLRAFRNRNYRLFFAGQTVSLIGTWVTRIATSWLVYRLTGSALLLGLVGFASQVPTFVLAPVAGVLVDRWDRHRILVITQLLAMVQSAALAVLAFTGAITVPWVLALGAAQGVINAFDTPARQSLVVEMVERREDLPNAIALNSSMVNAARLVGPSLGGVLIASVGEAWCFLLDSVSYVAVIASLVAMRVARRARPARTARVWEELRTGVRYAWGFPPIRSALLLLALVSLMGMPYTVLMPVIAARVLGGGPHTLGFLSAASGVGALGGALYLANRRSVLGLGRAMVVATAACGAGLVVFGRSHSLWLSLLVLPVIGAGMMIEMAATNTVLQTIVDETMRGRVMAFYTMAFMGTAPFGSLLAGVLAERIGTQWTIVIGGLACLAGAVWFARALPALRRQLRPIYVARGILPGPVPSADASAA